MLTTILTAILGSATLAQLIIFFVQRRDNKKNIPAKLETLEKDTLRTQILLLILLKPEEKQEILTVSQHYFVVKKGDWYLTSVFNNWITEQGIAEPEWFDKTK